MRGRVFEKVGVNISTVHGTFSKEFAQIDPGRRRRPALLGRRHLARRPHAEPARAGGPHEHAPHRRRSKAWFGGGADLTPMYRRTKPTPPTSTPRCATPATATTPTTTKTSKPGATSTSSCPTATKPRGVGGIFYDYLDTGDWEADFAFTRDVGLALLERLSRRSCAAT